MSTHQLNAPVLLDILRQQTKIRQHKYYTQSRLTTLRAERVALRQTGKVLAALFFLFLIIFYYFLWLERDPT